MQLSEEALAVLSALKRASVYPGREIAPEMLVRYLPTNSIIQKGLAELVEVGLATANDSGAILTPSGEQFQI